jgi:hypothetical protein
MSTIAVGPDVEEVRRKTAAEAKNRAMFYESQGYKVTLKAFPLQPHLRSAQKKQKDPLTMGSGTAA